MGFAAVAMTACSSDEPAPKGDENPDWNLGEEAYMTVNIVDAEASRSISDGGYEFGDVNSESKVYNARFFFFDDNKIFVSEASRWDDAGMNGTDKTQNIEHFGENVLVIRKNKSQSTPKYLLTVINARPEFRPASTLEGTAQMLLSESVWTDKDGNKHFIMSTTSYYGGTEDTHADDYYYTNVLDAKYFYKEPAPTTIDGLNVVNVYVERLAAKVQVVISKDLENEAKDFDGVKAYKLPVTVGGNGNGAIDDATAATAIYVKFIGWGLNSTAKNTYLSKQLNGSDWNPFTDWNKPEHFRSFWGMGEAYDKVIDSKYPNTYLNYLPAEQLKGNIQISGALSEDNALYCNEYTHKADDNLFKSVVEIENGASTTVNRVIPAYTTSVVLRAIACDENGNALDLVLHGGVLFNKPDFKSYLLNTIGNETLNFYTYTGSETIPSKDEDWTDGVRNNFKQIDQTFVDFVSAGQGTGSIKVVAKIPENTKLYKKTTENDVVKFVEITNAEADLNAVLSTAQNADTWGKSIAYTGGEMVYTIPIEHLNADKTTLGDGETNPADQKREGYYGVVRNHWYRITVDSLVKMGHGIFNPGDGSEENPGEPIIPDEPEDPTYYLGAKINILSWKIVNQSAGI